MGQQWPDLDERDLWITMKVAEAVMKLADKMSHNSELSVIEIDTFLKGTPYEAFASWMLVNSQRNFKKFDRDKNGAIVLEELQMAVHAFMEEQKQFQPPLESPKPPPPPKGIKPPPESQGSAKQMAASAQQVEIINLGDSMCNLPGWFWMAGCWPGASEC